MFTYAPVSVLRAFSIESVSVPPTSTRPAPMDTGRVDPTATGLLVLRGELAGASGWDQDLIGCSVEAVIRPPGGRCDEFLRERLDYGNHLQWVYGDYVEPLERLGEMLGLQVKTIA